MCGGFIEKIVVYFWKEVIDLSAINSKFKEKLTETLKAVIPILVIVLLLCFSIAPIPPSVLVTFLLGAIFLWKKKLGEIII